MPLVYVRSVAEDVELGLWRMDEDEALPSPVGVDLSGYHGLRLREKLSTYALLEAMTGQRGLSIRHNDADRPLLDNCHISLSHTRGWVAMMLSKTHGVGVDVEYVSPRVLRIVPRFVRPDETVTDIRTGLIHWTAKEAVYKLFSEEDLMFFDMRLGEVPYAERGVVVVDDLKHPKNVEAHFVSNDDYVLTWVAR